SEKTQKRFFVPCFLSPELTPELTADRHESYRGPRQPGAEVRGHPAQRRVRRGRLPRGRPRVLAVPGEVRGVRRGTEGGRRDGPLGQAAHVHEPERAGGPGGPRLLPAAGR